jgi:hypothetical protein
MDLPEVGWEGGMNWIDLVQDRGRWQAVVSAAMNVRRHIPRGHILYVLMVPTLQKQRRHLRQTAGLLEWKAAATQGYTRHCSLQFTVALT